MLATVKTERFLRTGCQKVSVRKISMIGSVVGPTLVSSTHSRFGFKLCTIWKVYECANNSSVVIVVALCVAQQFGGPFTINDQTGKKVRILVIVTTNARHVVIRRISEWIITVGHWTFAEQNQLMTEQKHRCSDIVADRSIGAAGGAVLASWLTAGLWLPH